ncbi:glycine-rich domain-containing protein [Streptomyces sp. NPDC002120]|uniref:glycine-rich domain-containing protein n=1 Tax=Streptomyces sp. NPDC002120 TaxID=3364631 RepID=UPI0036C22945
MTITQENASALALISPELSARLIEGVRENKWPELTDEQGERGVAQMVGFLVAGARSKARLAPSKRVDWFWHEFIKHTRSYSAFGDLVAGEYIHHEPHETPAPIHEKEEARERTVRAVADAGFTVDAEFWPDVATDCSQCYDGCSNSPNSGKK